MNRSGIFQVAFEQQRYGKSGVVKQEPPVGDVEDRWIHEQRLQIDHPSFFCGQGDSPPFGVDDTRPRGAWYLHQTSQQPTQQQQQQQQQERGQQQQQQEPVSLPVPRSRTPDNLTNGSGSGGQSNTSTSTAVAAAVEAALRSVPPQSNTTGWGRVTHNLDNDHQAQNVAGATIAGTGGA